MAPYLLFPLFSLLLIFSLPLSTADGPIQSICTENSYYSPNSIFQTNLNSLLVSLFSSAPVTGFANNKTGDNPDMVYGLALCRADVSPTTCRSCLADASQGVAKACPLKREATVFYDPCLLRYSDKDFFGKSSNKIFFSTNGEKVTLDRLIVFNRLLGNLLNGVVNSAARSTMMVAVDSHGYGESNNLYALVQCTRDLSPGTCDSCLGGIIDYSAECCGTTDAARIYGDGCFLRYDTIQFYNDTAIRESIYKLYFCVFFYLNM